HHVLREGRGRPEARPGVRRRLAARALGLGLAIVVAIGTPARAVDERELGRRFLLAARAELPIVQDPVVAGYVERIGEKLVAVLGPQSFDYRFYVVQHPALNAFAVPGGYVFVFSGLLARVNTDDELAGVLAHALGAFFKELLADQRINSAGVPAYMLTHPLTEDRVANVATAITSQHLKTPAGRPASGTELPEAQAVARGIAEPADVVIARYRRM